jgi:hypothetical protein
MHLPGGVECCNWGDRHKSSARHDPLIAERKKGRLARLARA